MNKSPRKKAYRKGHIGEFIACFLLIIKGYSIKERRYKTPVGEIDIIAKRGRAIIFCEVKVRKDYVTAIESITVKQRERISRAAQYYMSCLKTGPKNNKIDNLIYRCDMILILPWRWPVHIENAW